MTSPLLVSMLGEGSSGVGSVLLTVGVSTGWGSTLLSVVGSEGEGNGVGSSDGVSPA